MLRQVSSAGVQRPRAGRGKPQQAIYALVRCCRRCSSKVYDCGPYTLSRGEGARLHHGGAALCVLGQLLEASFPRPIWPEPAVLEETRRGRKWQPRLPRGWVCLVEPVQSGETPPSCHSLHSSSHVGQREGPWCMGRQAEGVAEDTSSPHLLHRLCLLRLPRALRWWHLPCFRPGAAQCSQACAGH
jgi:hypothetical protein